MGIANILQLLVSGITIGSVYGLVGLGFVTVYRCSGIVNFAQGEFVMLGGMLTYYLWKTMGLSYPLAAAAAVVIVGLVGIAMYQLIIAPLRRAYGLIIVMATLGFSMLLQSIALVWWGSYPNYLPTFTGEKPLTVGGVAITPQNIWVLLMAAAALLVLYLVNNRTRFGKAMTATATDPLAAGLVGVRTGSMIRWSFGISAVIGAIAGVFVSPVIGITFASGSLLGLKGFVAAVLGGWGKSSGAFVGGLLLGVIETLGAGFLPAGYKDAVAFLVLLIALYFRPSGILGSALTETE